MIQMVIPDVLYRFSSVVQLMIKDYHLNCLRLRIPFSNQGHAFDLWSLHFIIRFGAYCSPLSFDIFLESSK